MKIFASVFCIILYSSAQQCVSNLQYYDIFATENEQQEWDMNTLFFTGDNLQYKITQESPYFQVFNPLHLVGQSTNALNLKILSFKPQKSYNDRSWTNKFVALGVNETYFQLLYSEDGILNQNQVPNFTKSIAFRSYAKNFTCFDFDFISENKVVIDCTLFDLNNPQDDLNGLFIFDLNDKNDFNIEFIDNPFGYNNSQYRIVEFHHYKSSPKDSQSFYFRSEPVRRDDQSTLKVIQEKDNILEVFQFTSKFTLKQRSPVMVLTNQILAQLLQVDENVFKFQLIDFKIGVDSNLYILDSNIGLCELSLNLPSSSWMLHNLYTNQYQSPLLGFDVNYQLNKQGTSTKKLIFLFKDKLILFENGIMLFVIRIPNIDSQDTFQIQMSQKYIMLKIKTTIYQYSIENGKKIYTCQENILNLVVNPNYDDAVGINSQIAKRFFLNNGVLRLNQNDKAISSKIVTLTAENIEQQSKKCSVTINLLVQNKNEQQILQFNKNPFNTIVTIPSDSLILDKIASGPNLQYSPIEQQVNDFKSSIPYTIQSLINLKIEGIYLPNPKDIVYSDILVMENQAQFYLIFQVYTKIIYIYQFEHVNKNSEQLTFLQQNTIAFDSLLDKTVGFCQWYTLHQIIFFIYQSSQFSIDIYYYDRQLKKVSTIMFNDQDIKNEITSIAIISDIIYAVQPQTQTVYLIELVIPYSIILQINNNIISKFDVSEKFTPIKVFGNNINNMAFIQTQNSLLIGNYNNRNSPNFLLHKVMPLQTGLEIGIAIGKTSFFLIKVSKSQQLIEEYNYQYLQNIYKLKDVPLFNYKLQRPLTYDYSFYTGWLYIRASDGIKTYILVYQPNVLSHISLNKVIDIQGLITDEQTLNMAVGGVDQMFLYYNNNTHNQVLSILSKPRLYFTPKPDQVEYVNNQVISVQISSFSGVKPITQSAQITLLNTQSSLFIQQNLFDSQKKVFVFVKQSGIQYISMGTDWYSGQVTNFDLQCIQCKSEAKILSNLQLINDGSYFGSTILDGASFGQAGQVYQTRNALIFVDLNSVQKQKLVMNLTTEDCYQISISVDYTFIISAWQDKNNQVGLFIHKCKFQEVCSQFRQGIQTFTNLQKIAKTFMPDQKNIILLNTNVENYSAFQNFIVIATLDDDGTQFTIAHKYIIHNQYVATSQLFIADFDFIDYYISGNHFATLLFTDINVGIYFAHFSYNDQGILVKTTYELFKVINFSDDQFYIDDDTRFLQVKVISFSLNGNILSLNVLVTTNNQAKYVFGIDLNAQKPQFGLPIIKSSIQLAYVLTPYGNWPSIAKLAFIDGNIAIPYTNGKNVVVGIYQLPKLKQKITQVVPFTHALSSENNNIKPQDFFMLFNKDSQANYPYFFININYNPKYQEYLVQKYQMRSDPQLMLGSSFNYQNELQIKLCLKNDFSEICGNALLTNNKSTKDQTSSIQQQQFLSST